MWREENSTDHLLGFMFNIGVNFKETNLYGYRQFGHHHPLPNLIQKRSISPICSSVRVIGLFGIPLDLRFFSPQFPYLQRLLDRVLPKKGFLKASSRIPLYDYPLFRFSQSSCEGTLLIQTFKIFLPIPKFYQALQIVGFSKFFLHHVLIKC